MSTFERENYQWRETYFVLFDSCQRPTLKHVEEVLHALSGRFQLTGGIADEDDRFESVTLFRPMTTRPWTSVMSPAMRSWSRGARCTKSSRLRPTARRNGRN